MSERDRKRLREIHTFPALVKYLREDLGWPVEQDSFDDLDDITFDWEADELGIDPDQAAKIEYIKQLRPLEHGEPQGVFFVKFDTKNLPVVALRRLLGKLVVKKRASAGAAERPLWQMRNLVFISSYGESDERQLSFAYFQEPEHRGELPSLKVLGWDAGDTPLHLDRVHDQLEAHLAWPENAKELPQWRKQWSAAFELRHGEVVTTAKQLAEQLAALARGIRERANQLLRLETETGPLRTLMEGFKKALIHDLTEDQFADMYAQTIAYGLLSARITHPDPVKDPVKAETLPDLIPVTNPFLKELMETFVLAGGKHRGRKRGHHLDFDELGINDVVELLRRANMDAVLRNFGADDRREDPVTYFYEDFLNAYDAQERKRRGVYYTPKPVVSYIVRSVHELLQSEFGIEDGLASTITWGEMAKRHLDLKIPQGVAAESPFVQILDPATGTATFLVTVIEVIYDTLTEKWTKQKLSDAQRVAAWNEYVPKHLLPRLYGYELMMAPYAIAHLKVGLKLFETDYRFGSDERARIYLTNALEPAGDASYSQIDALSEALAHEAQAVNLIKKSRRFTVVIGNPPYSILSANLAPLQRGMVERYKFVDGERIRERGALQFEKNVQDDYVKFFALAEDVLAASAASILGYVSNANYLDASTLRGLRASLCRRFPIRLLTDLHGDGTGAELPGAAGLDQNVFDILQGVAVGLFAAPPGSKGSTRTARVDIGGSRAYKMQMLSGVGFRQLASTSLDPRPPSYDFVPSDERTTADWKQWAALPELYAQYSAGIITARDHLVIDDDRACLVDRIEKMRDSRLSTSAVLAAFEVSDKRGWDADRARTQLRHVRDVHAQTKPVAYRPFDGRWIFYHESLVWGRAYPTMQHVLGCRNLVLAVCKQLHKRTDPWAHAFVCRSLGESSFVSNKSKEVTSFFPLLLCPSGEAGLFDGIRLNDGGRLEALENVVAVNASAEASEIAELCGAYVYAILHSPRYRTLYRDNLAREFPRIPLPRDQRLGVALGRLGRQLVALHLLETPKVEQFSTTFIGPRNPVVSRVGWSDDTVWLDAEATKKGQHATAGTIGFRGVPNAVWSFHVGAYQVCEKWLKDRKGRKLLKVDIEHYQKIVVALSETIRIMKEIDEVIEKHGGWPGAFKTREAHVQ